MSASRPAVLFLLMFWLTGLAAAQSQPVSFSWDGATVYRVITDRFSNGDRENNFAYGRGLDGTGTPYDVDSTGHFLGGDYSGLNGWLTDGYFTDLGINALQISAPWEQVHGWVGGGFGEYQRYAYDAAWPLDFTEADRAFGTFDEFVALVDSAHQQGIRVLLEISLNHVGPPTLNDMAAFRFGGITSEDWRTWRPASKSGWQSYNGSLVTTSDSTKAWQRWWGSDWIRADLPGYVPCGSDSQTACVNQLPDIRDDVDVSSIPAFLRLKWGEEKTALESASLDSFFERTGYRRTAMNHVIKWLSDWVAATGVDGFVMRDVQSTPPDAIRRLKDQATRSLSVWKENHPDKAMNEEGFWLGVDLHDQVAEASFYASMGFDSVANYSFPDAMKHSAKDQFSNYAEANETVSRPFLWSAISSPETGLYDRAALKKAADRLLLSRGGVSLYYGDESARRPGPEGVEARERATSHMNWASFDEGVFSHWKKVGAFRQKHPAIARGGHDLIQDEPYAFYRGVWQGMDKDQVVVVMGASGKTRVNVSIVWPDDTVLRDAYTGSIAIVSFGQVSFQADPSGLILIEEVK